MAARSPAERAAQQVLERARREFESLGEPWDGYRVDVELLAALLFELGVQPVYDLRVGTREYAAFLDGNGRLIAVEGRHHPHRQRFSVAHEVGHFVLHFKPHMGLFTCSSQDMQVSPEAVRALRGPAAAGGGGPGGPRPPQGRDPRLLHLQREVEANLFASELLMPEQPLRAMHKVTGGKLFALARHFDVSPQAMEIRLERLNLPIRR
ncbi:MAG: ImmA/IrrE family metallo-endopeptidase [Bacillota bacterium]